ncbi:hypothetical protein A0J57_09035 [Sphingobium sp. 22B]|uniref:NAD(P)-dependent oxidoreductase n=1 Tax=unclassified Sphingobium TaxID=2611147 RepID=UPI000783C4E7|nr:MULTISPECIES: NAD(P)-dependent oxidoreductase [unclassified Sphingobium]KXU32681.1 hypothetical protein AXW74_06525 [Sphingobium sp. AM]KYC32758.1 hypothetical protein A0J57_09035 [Sphingobium sp. 22B]OAP31647.1 hypothetical protein A8O16_12490 [Sphingobium sp. 20006FA]
MTGFTIASQFTAGANEELRRSGCRVIDLPRGAPASLPDDVAILVATPFEWRGAARPEGWPWNIRWVQLASAGIDAYPDWLFEAPIVTAAAGVTAQAVAEFAITAVFAAIKAMPDCWIGDAGEWAWRDVQGIAGKTLGILGYGHIGKRVAAYGRAFGMDLLVARRSVDMSPPEGVEYVPDIDTLIARSDHLVLAAPATPATRHILNEATLANAKPGIHIVNVARGALIDQDALLGALEAGQVGLATLDVSEPEPLPPGHPFYAHPRVRLSPHISFLTPDLGARLVGFFTANLARFRAGDGMEGVVIKKPVSKESTL